MSDDCLSTTLATPSSPANFVSDINDESDATTTTNNNNNNNNNNNWNNNQQQRSW